MKGSATDLPSAPVGPLWYLARVIARLGFRQFRHTPRTRFRGAESTIDNGYYAELSVN